jgi:hypothetical protein
MKTRALLQAYLDQGVKRVVVTAPVKEAGVLNVVMASTMRSTIRPHTPSSPPPPAPPTAWRPSSR